MARRTRGEGKQAAPRTGDSTPPSGDSVALSSEAGGADIEQITETTKRLESRLSQLGPAIAALFERIEQAAGRVTEAVEKTGAELQGSEKARAKKTGKLLTSLDTRLERIDRILESGTVIDPSGLGRDLAIAAQVRRDSLVKITEPLVLISQIARSGGTLLSQLFDSHPQCHAHPHELYLGHPDHHDWPQIPLDVAVGTWWKMLHEEPAEAHFMHGYRKSEGLKRDDWEIFPFLYVPTLARQLFEDLVRAKPMGSPRDVLNAYLTAYFNAWLDNQNLYGPDKRWVVAFAPRLIMRADNRDGFFADYPDGRIVSIVREPKGWYASAYRWRPEAFEDVEASAELWRKSTLASVAAKEAYDDKVLLVRFEGLVKDTSSTMKAIVSFLGIDLPETAIMPSFNGWPIRANSSFDERGHGVVPGPATRGSTLEQDVREKIDSLVAEAYESALALAI